MIIFKGLTAQNFMSIGNLTQSISFLRNGLTLILGENLDLGGGSSRNGAGKTTILNALSFALYGIALVNIKRDLLINHTNMKGLVVSLDYSVDNKNYRIERGRKPNFLKFYVNDGLVNSPDTDEAAGESKWTQNEIEKSINGLSHTLFKNFIAIHTKMIPFLSLREKEQREIIEELLGITALSNKAELLKDQTKTIRDEIKEEEIRIKTIIESNEKIQKHINDLKFKSQIWDREHSKKLEKFQESVIALEHVDIEDEITAHKIYEIYNLIETESNQLQTEAMRLDKALERNNKELSNLSLQLNQINEHNCPTCGNQIHDTQQELILKSIQDKQSILTLESNQTTQDLTSLCSILEEKLAQLTEIGDPPQRAYKTLEQALNHRHTLDKLHADIARELSIENPFFDQIANLTDSGLQDTSYEYLNQLTRLKEHQDFLYKLLTSKESFIRKKIIDQNLLFLNRKLNSYLTQLQLPHEVIFQSDLSVEISNVGKEYDFEQLSNGEANRLILALSWAFRDIWESMNNIINLLIVDELIDSGMDLQGTDTSIELLKRMSTEKNKNIFLISHKDGLESRMDNVLLIQKENNFTVFSDSLME